LRRHRLAHGEVHQVVLAEFANRSGDDAFNFVLKNALAIDLEQPPALYTSFAWMANSR